MAQYRFLFSPVRYTSLPLAVVEAMTIGMPIVALATTELPTVIEHGVTGYVSCELDELVDRMEYLLAEPEFARAMGERARLVAQERFNLQRFESDWNAAFRRALELRRP
jgi:glycosyltransferase involved in cell wall biosynthesis